MRLSVATWMDMGREQTYCHWGELVRMSIVRDDMARNYACLPGLDEVAVQNNEGERVVMRCLPSIYSIDSSRSRTLSSIPLRHLWHHHLLPQHTTWQGKQAEDQAGLPVTRSASSPVGNAALHQSRNKETDYSRTSSFILNLVHVTQRHYG